MELLALIVPPLLIAFALAMEAVEDRLLRRGSQTPGARENGPHPTPPADVTPGPPHIPGRGTPSATDRDDRAA